MPFITTEVEVRVNLSEFEDEDIREEYEKRFGGEEPFEDEIQTDDRETLIKIFQAMRTNQRDKAHALMWDYVCDKLGRIA